jgi:hypothetical protein
MKSNGSVIFSAAMASTRRTAPHSLTFARQVVLVPPRAGLLRAARGRLVGRRAVGYVGITVGMIVGMIVGRIVGGVVVGGVVVGGVVVGGVVVGGVVVGGVVVGGVVVGGVVVGGVVVGGVVVGLDVGALVWLGFALGVDLAGLRPDVDDVAGAGTIGVIEIGAVHDTVYFAGLEAAATGLVTTSTASPDAGSVRGVIFSAGRVFVPGRLKVTVLLAEFCPSASAQ